MKVIIISIIISLLSLAECDLCGLSHFNTSSGCRECFCSGVTDQCHEGEFYAGVTSIDFSHIKGFLVLILPRNLPYWTLVDLKNNQGYVITYEFKTNFLNLREGFIWDVPFTYDGNKAAMYGGMLKFVHRTRLVSDSEEFIEEPFRIYLLSSELDLVYEDARPWDRDQTLSFYRIPLSESSWRIAKDDHPLATRNDMMRTLITLNTIQIGTFSRNKRKSISLWGSVSIDLAVQSHNDTPRIGSIEICECPEGYTGDSCESCSFGYRRNAHNEIKSVFGACEPHVILPETDN